MPCVVSWGFNGGGAFVGFELFETKFDLSIKLLVLATELHASQFRDEQLEMIDFGPTSRDDRHL